MGNSRHNGLTVALLFVLAALALLAAARYSFKHDLPAARFARSLFARDTSDAPTATDTPAPGEEAESDAETNALADASALYGAFLREKLLPAYGRTDAGAIAAALEAGYAFPDGADSAGATGLCGATLIDLDGDQADELLVLLIRRDGDAFPLEAQIYRQSDGAVTEPPVATAEIIDLTRAKNVRFNYVSIVRSEDSRYLLYHQYAEEELAFYDRYVACDITGGAAAPVLDGVLSDYDGGALLLLSTVPPWLDAASLSDMAAITDPVSGVTGRLLYADAVADAQYAGEAVAFEAYTDAYEDAATAQAGMLGPLASDGQTVLLDPLDCDWTELVTLLAG